MTVPASGVMFDQVSKKFRRGERHDSLRDLVPALGRGLLRRGRESGIASDEFWALRDVSFTVAPGEALGVIGPNGAGKSTVLKLLTRILKPTSGVCSVQGRVGALIEVAAGFHPDLTGRENIFLQGAIMGMRRPEVARKLDQIVEFAGMAAFVDTPVKRYSSGMHARLGFSIAAHLEPAVLLIDEALAVGDMAFQAKCLERMAAFKREGAAIVFVSHNLQAVATLCDRALHLAGAVRALGPVGDVLASYTQSQQAPTALVFDEIAIVSTQLTHDSGAPVSGVDPRGPLRLRVTYRPLVPLADLTFGFIVYRSTDGLIVYDGNITRAHLGQATFPAHVPFTIEYHFRANLARGAFHLGLHVLHAPTHRFLARVNPAAHLHVRDTGACEGVADVDVRAVLMEPGP